MLFIINVVIFTLVNVFHDVVSEDLTRSLTFVIDDTFSMSDDINQVTLKTSDLFDAVLKSKDSEIEDFVLVTFNDPDVELRTITKEKQVFKAKLNEIHVHGGGDCPEMALTGIRLGIEKSRPHSLFYIFTDATAKDIHLYDEVQRKALKNFIQVTFLLTGDCDMRDSPNYKVFKRLADVTGGQVFNIAKDQVHEILNFIIDTIKDKKVILYNQHFPAKEDEITSIQYPFSVDGKVKSYTLSLSGKSPTISVKDSTGNDVKSEVIMKSEETYIIKISPAVPGNYIASTESMGESNLKIIAATQLSFRYGFLVIPPTTIEDCKKGVPSPVAGLRTYLTIQLSNEGNDVELESVEISDLKGNLIELKPLHQIKQGEMFYVADEFISPIDIFKIAVNGIDTSTKEKIRRNAATAVEPWNKKTEAVNEKEAKPIIEELKITNNEKTHKIQLKCNVKGFPEPDITMFDASDVTYTGNKISIGESSYVSVFETMNDRDNIFTCRATNSIGFDEKSINFKTVTEAPKIDKSIKAYFEDRGKSVDLFCRVVKGKPKPSISWFYKHPSLKIFKRLPNTDKNLHIDKLGIADAGTYRCKANNFKGYDTSDIQLQVRYPPYIVTPEKVSAILDDHVKLDCDVRAVPLPNVRWFYEGREIVNGGRYTIYQNHTLSFIAIKSDTGTYKCEATNTLGDANGEIHLDVNFFIPASIRIPLTRVFNLDVGSSVSLDCVAEGLPKPTVKWIFKPFYGCCEKNPGAIFDNNTFAMDKVRTDQAGYYICTAQNSIDAVKLYYEVNVKAPPSIVHNLVSKKITAVVGDVSLKIPCFATGHPKPDIIWLRDGFQIALGTDYNVENGTLIIREIDIDMAGSVSCVATNKYGNAIETFEIEVLPSPDLDKVAEELCINKDAITDIECELPHSKLDLVRWYKGKTLQPITNLSLYGKPSDPDIYTCRVSNYLDSKFYQIRIDICSPPEFLSNEPTTIDYSEDTPSFTSCKASGHPAPKVVWYHNDRRLRETKQEIFVFGVGVFTCEISNSFGSISRTFNIVGPNCTLDIKRHFAKPEPLLLTKTRLIPKFDVVDYKVNITKDESIVLHCQNSYIEYSGRNLGESIQVICDKDTIFKTATQRFDYKDIKCHEPIKSSLKNTGIPCSSVSKNNIVRVGYKLNTQFVLVYEVCFDRIARTPIYIRNVLQKSYVNVMPSMAYEDGGFMPFDFDSVYDCGKQSRDISRSTWTTFYRKGGCFEKQHLINPSNLFPSIQPSAFKYINVWPQWSYYKANWDAIERRVAALVNTMDHALVVINGVFDQLSMETSFGVDTKISLFDKYGRSVAVPKYFWKVVIDDEKEAGVVIVLINSPDIASHADAEKYILCKDICDEVSWLRSPDWKDYTKGYTYCCTYQEFRKKFKDVCFVKSIKRVLV